MRRIMPATAAKATRYYTTTQAAPKVEMSASSVRRLCILHDIGLKMPNGRMLTDDDLQAIRDCRPKMGRPPDSENS